MSVLLSDEDCKVVGFNVSGDNPNIISVGANELTAFSKAESDCKKKTIHLVVPATKSHPHFELKSTSKKGHVTLGENKVSVSADWQTYTAVNELQERLSLISSRTELCLGFLGLRSGRFSSLSWAR